MIEPTNVQLQTRALIVDDQLAVPTTAGGRAVRALATELTRQNVDVVESLSFVDGTTVATSDATITCIFVTWTLGDDDDRSHREGLELLRKVRSFNAKIPIFLMADRHGNRSITVEVMGLSDEFVWLLEDTAPFIVGRALAAMQRYLDMLLPPFSDHPLPHGEEWAPVHWHLLGMNAHRRGGCVFFKMRSLKELTSNRDRVSNFPNQVCGSILTAVECLWQLCRQVLYMNVAIGCCRAPSRAPGMLISDIASQR